jgi:predicted Rossmann fold nucleotide-binding protein DprA/Smf involved in DNA uptake
MTSIEKVRAYMAALTLDALVTPADVAAATGIIKVRVQYALAALTIDGEVARFGGGFYARNP